MACQACSSLLFVAVTNKYSMVVFAQAVWVGLPAGAVKGSVVGCTRRSANFASAQGCQRIHPDNLVVIPGERSRRLLHPTVEPCLIIISLVGNRLAGHSEETAGKQRIAVATLQGALTGILALAQDIRHRTNNLSCHHQFLNAR